MWRHKFCEASRARKKGRKGTSEAAAAAMGHAVGVVAVGNVALVEVDLAGGGAAALDGDALHGLGDAVAAVNVALRQRVDLLEAGCEAQEEVGSCNHNT